MGDRAVDLLFGQSPANRSQLVCRPVFPDDGIFTVAVLSADTESSRQVGRTGRPGYAGSAPDCRTTARQRRPLHPATNCEAVSRASRNIAEPPLSDCVSPSLPSRRSAYSAYLFPSRVSRRTCDRIRFLRLLVLDSHFQILRHVPFRPFIRLA